MTSDSPAVQRFVVFLRGINVGGINIRMAELKKVIAALPVDRVVTILATGNVVLSTALSGEQLKTRVEGALREAFGYDAWVIVLGAAGLRAVFEACTLPLNDPSTHTYVTLASDSTDLDALMAEAAAADVSGLERLSPVALAWPAPVGSSTDVPFARITAKAKYKATTTTRNLRTLAKVVAAL